MNQSSATDSAMLARGFAKTPQHARGIFVLLREPRLARIETEQGGIQRAGNDLHAALAMLRHQHLNRIAIRKNPRRVRKCACDERQLQHVPRIELDEEIIFPGAALRESVA